MGKLILQAKLFKISIFRSLSIADHTQNPTLPVNTTTNPITQACPMSNDARAAYLAASVRTDKPLYRAHIKPHRSLSNRGFFNTIMLTACAFLLPLLAFLGTGTLWTILLFVAPALTSLWYFIRRSDKDGTIREDLTLWPDLITVHRHNPRKADQYWLANPYWVSVHMRDTNKYLNYLTLKGAGREIELGAFLTAYEREDLEKDLRKQLAQATRAPTE